MINTQIKRRIRCMGCMDEYDEFTHDGRVISVCPHCGYVKDTAAKEAYHIQPGSILQGKYIVGKTLGYGGFGVTYIGYDALLERKLAIKEYLPTNFSTRMSGQAGLTVFTGENEEQFQAGLKSFVDEAQRLSKFNELAGTVDIYDSFQQNGTGYIVMEYLEGRTVKELLKENGVFKYEDAKAIILAVLATLAEVHTSGIIHRDVAPDNIFVLNDGSVRLIDFGASRYATTIHSKSLSVILKPGYAPEEQYRSRGEQGSWTDVYATTATFYKMITGITPEESAERMMKDDVKEPSKLGVKLPTNDENAIMNAMNVKISDRTRSADEFARQLTAGGEIKRAAVTLKKYDGGRIPRWAKIMASALSIFIITAAILIVSGVIDLRNGGFVSAITGSILAGDETRVPSILNEQHEEASRIAEEAELLLVISNKVYSDKVETGMVLSQDPMPGRILRKNSALNAVVSAGSETGIQVGIMPDLVFRTLEEAIAMLEEAGIEYELVYEESDTVAEGGIIRQNTTAGDRVSNGTKVIIVVSEGSKAQKDALEKAKNVYYKVTFVDWNGTVLSTQTILEGKNASAPANPKRAGYRFVKWSQDFTNITSERTITAVYEKIPSYTVRFVDWNGVTLNTQSVFEGDNASPPQNPERLGYRFTGWDRAYTNIKANLTVTAQYVQVPIYIVTFVDWDGRVLKTENVSEGANAAPPADPSRGEGWTFIGWKPDYTNVRKNLTVTAQYTQKATYEVTFVDWNDIVLKTQNVVEGGKATAPDNPVRYGYAFEKWDKAFTNVRAALTVKATYRKTLFTVKFVDWNGTVLKTQEVWEGGSATAPANPSRAEYHFKEWTPTPSNGSLSNVMMDITAKATYTPIPKYTVTFVDWNGTVLKTQSVLEYGAATAPAFPTTGSAEGWVGNGWSPSSFSYISSNLTVKATYKKKLYDNADWVWGLSVPNGITNENADLTTKTQYQYRDKNTMTNTTGSTPSGYTLASMTQSGWQNWSAWQDASITASSTRDVQTQTVESDWKTQYQYSRYVCKCFRAGNPPPSSWVEADNYYVGDYGNHPSHGLYGPYYTPWFDSPLTNFGRAQADSKPHYGTYLDEQGWASWFANYWYNETTRQVAIAWKTQYRYRDAVFTYTYESWSAWSGWSDTVYTASNTREVNTQILRGYRRFHWEYR